MKSLACIAIALVLSGCAQYQAAAAQRAAQGADDMLRASAYGVCTAATDGALERKWQVNTNPNGSKAVSRRILCYDNDEPVN